jgi:hypothetical protein
LGDPAAQTAYLDAIQRATTSPAPVAPAPTPVGSLRFAEGRYGQQSAASGIACRGRGFLARTLRVAILALVGITLMSATSAAPDAFLDGAEGSVGAEGNVGKAIDTDRASGGGA